MKVGFSRGSALTVTGAVWVAAVWSGLGCESGRVQPPAPGPEAAAAAVPAGASHEASSPAGPAPSGAARRFGAALEPAAPVPLASLLNEPKAYAGKTITTEGRVQRACSRKGCWMEIGSGEDSCRITFKDYGFFVPTDSAGAFAKVQGRLDTREVEAAAVEHLESEGAHFRNKRSDGSATEVRMIASAVELRR
jgi:uncharacterized protein DUF4920